ncbi:hypothetical protein [uncultured Erythrobacter sp.]|uniref:hypothetical protein n=1 Tax=uncultured Erythrobacter sp. TaxID=263913 RepID=UPI00263149C6|nr:hypothetical protein [uncultured Erythrobacter sp.]
MTYAPLPSILAPWRITVRQSAQTTRRKRSRPPSFTPVQVKSRKDGWSPEVQCAFLAALFRSGSVTAAARTVGRSRASAYKLRERRGAESFARSWDQVLAGPSIDGSRPTRRRTVADWRKLTFEELIWRHEVGLWRPVMYRGNMRSIERKPDNSALLRLISRIGGGETLRSMPYPRERISTLPQTGGSLSHPSERGPPAKEARSIT